jgi:hypothetical protein
LAKEPSITSVSSGFSSAETLNNNFEEVKAAFRNTISRDGSSPNNMNADFDMNSNDILNVKTLGADTVNIGGVAMSLSTLNTSVSNSQRFLTPSATDPSLRDDGSALVIGDLYFNTAEEEMRLWTGSAFVPLNSASITVDTFTGDNSTVAFTLSQTVLNENNTLVYINGVVSHKSAYSISGTTLTFSVAPGSSAAIEVVIYDLQAVDTAFTVVTNRTELKAAGTSSVQFFDENLWWYDSSVSSGTYSADTQEGIYVSPTGSGSGAWVRQYDNGTINPRWFGAAGDGSTDDATAILACLEAASGKVIDGEGLTYRLDSLLTGTKENFTVKNATFDLSNVSAPAGFRFTGSVGTSTNVSAAITRGARSIPVADSSIFTVDQFVWLASTSEFYATTGSVVLGFFAKIKSIDNSTQVTLYEDVNYPFAYSSPGDITLAPATLKQNICFDSVKFIGAGAGSQTALRLILCEDPVVKNCSFEYLDYIATSFDQSVNCLAYGVDVRYARATGLAYGVVVENGSYSVQINKGFGQDLRHYVSVGNNGGVNRYISVDGNHVVNAVDGGIDSHPACDFFSVTYNTIEGAAVMPTGDGIVCQAPNFICTGNTIQAPTRHGILYQPLSRLGSPSASFSNNYIDRGPEPVAWVTGTAYIVGDKVTESGVVYTCEVAHTSGTFATDLAAGKWSTSSIAGINIVNTGDVDLKGLSISHNTVKGGFTNSISIDADTSDIFSVVVSGNTLIDSDTNGISFSCSTGKFVDKGTVFGNVVTGAGAGSGIIFAGTGTGKIKNVICSDNVIDGFIFGVRFSLCEDSSAIHNHMLNISADPFQTDSSCSGIQIIPLKHTNPQTFSSGVAFAMEEDDTDLIFDRSATVALTLMDAAVLTGHELRVKTLQAQTVVSATPNVCPSDSATPGTAILPATAGSWAMLKSDGTNWVIMMEG